MCHFNRTKAWRSVTLAITAAATVFSGCGGRAISLSTEGLLGAAVITGTGETRVDGSDIGSIYNVTQVVQATSGNPYATAAELPFTGPSAAIGSPVTDGQTPFHFDYSYPANNYKLSEAHIIIDTQRDTSDTEGIFVDGIFSGRPPLGALVNSSCPQVTYATYVGNISGLVPNPFYIDEAVKLYKQLTRNTFDLNISDLVTSTPLTPSDLVKDGFLPVVTGDDSQVFQGFLVLKGYTISKTPLTCQNSPTYTFQNVFLHNDGNTISAAAFNNTVGGPFASWGTTQSGFQAVELYYQAQLPRVTAANISISQATVSLTVIRNTTASATSAVVINGVGVSEAGFDTAQATTAVESWDTGAARTYWSSWVAAIPADGLSHAVTLNLVSLLGTDRVRTLILQGKFNLALAGSLGKVQASNATSARARSAPVTGPELSLGGTYFTELCEIPNDPTSPLSDNDPLPSNAGDHQSPTVSSNQATEITSSSALVQWLTNEPADSEVGFGIGNTSTLSIKDTTLTTFHQVRLTGLQPYKVYTFRVYTADGNGNLTTTGTKTFQTLR